MTSFSNASTAAAKVIFLQIGSGVTYIQAELSTSGRTIKLIVAVPHDIDASGKTL